MPLEKRDASRLMVLRRADGSISHEHFYQLIDHLHPGDCLVMNDSRVIPARLLGHRMPSGGAAEVLLLTDKTGKTPKAYPRRAGTPGKKPLGM